jgi:hypothetical protein
MRLDLASDAPTCGGSPLAARTVLGRWLAALPDEHPAADRHLVALRFFVVNLVASALLAAAWLEGWLATVVAGDQTGLVLVIAATFLAGLVECGRRLLQVSADLDRVAGACGPGRGEVDAYLRAVAGRDPQSRAIATATLKLKLSARIATVRHVAASLVVLGLIGTVIGFIIALSGVEAGAAADVASVGPMVSTLVSGMSVALYTTLVGAVLNIWLTVDYRLLESATVRLLAAAIELGERHARD